MKDVIIKNWRGLKNTTSPDRFKPGEMLVAQNVDIDNTEMGISRLGFTSVNGAASHSLWSDGTICLVVQNAVLKRFNEDTSLTTLKVLQSNAFMDYVSPGNGTVYYSNGVDQGRVAAGTALSWGVPQPRSQPTPSVVGGALPVGRYMFALTFLRKDGHEGGTRMSGIIDVPAYAGNGPNPASGAGISFTSIEASTNPEITGKILCLSTPNGETLYRAAVIPNGVTSYVYDRNTLDLTVPLRNLEAGPPPLGTILEYYNGVLYVCSGGVAYQSDPYGLELFRIADQFLQFPGRLTLFAAVNDGIYVGTDQKMFFLAGDRPDQLKSRQIFDYGAIEGTSYKTDASYFTKREQGEEFGDDPRPVVIWASPRGIHVGYDGGVVKNLTEGMYSFPTAQRGAGVLRDVRGYTQFLTSLQGTGSADNFFS